MTILSMIVAHANNRVIGKNNDMPWHLPADLAYFKKTTLGKPIIMGRKTYQSIGRPLPGRKNIVISRDNNFRAEGVEVVNSVDAALALVVDSAEVMVIGGGAIYQHCLAVAQRLYITHINAAIDGDTHFPEYDLTVWQKVTSDIRPSDEKNPYQLDFSVYEKI
ncbi:type 3 dihydrofolate reductase [Colwellia sp. MB02u-6]|jgi:dihydrofolate reductase|uniref:type 3 dihydrofolate reductase n=1 Tax=Colwellia sp. MB02u-6 TaxID=2759824 RepID=UPI0015F75B7B|nr:type 3 dihydrofolate reductase [Colwellia sp. MB02u-6]MBA6326913.1 type 3 dihydrofolate reductase [Colwellia sp. MB02u-6]